MTSPTKGEGGSAKRGYYSLSQVRVGSKISKMADVIYGQNNMIFLGAIRHNFDGTFYLKTFDFICSVMSKIEYYLQF